MGYYCEIHEPEELKDCTLQYRMDEGCEKYIRSFWYESVNSMGDKKFVNKTKYQKKLYLCLELDKKAKNHEDCIRLALKPELPGKMEKIGSVSELMERAEKSRYEYNRRIDEDAELLKAISPIIAGFGILACVEQGENPEPEAIAQESIRFSKALIEELNKETR